MRTTLWLVAALIGLTGAGLGVWQLAAQTSDEDSGIAAPGSTVPYAQGTPPRIVNGHVPPATVVPTGTPDLSNAVSPEIARQKLSEKPRIEAVLDAVAARDTERILSLIDWLPHGCGLRDSETCPEGLTARTELPMVNVSTSVPYWVTAETLRPRLAEVLAGEPLAIGYAARVTTTSYLDDRDPAGQIYLLGLEGPPRPVSPSTIWGDATTRTGLFLVLDDGAEHPALALSFLSGRYSATDQGADLSDRFGDHDIITFDPR